MDYKQWLFGFDLVPKILADILLQPNEESKTLI